MAARSSGSQDNLLDLEISHPPSHRPFYTSGDTIHGRIILHNSQATPGVGASIEFRGVARTRVGSTTSESNLLLVALELHSGQSSGDDFVWPFEFILPSGTQPGPINKSKYSGDRNFNRSPGHPLPPTFERGTRSETDADDIAIRYSLEATVSKPHLTHAFQPEILQVERSLAFSPTRETGVYRPILSPIVKSLTTAGAHLTDLQATHHSLRDQHSFREQFLPTVDLPHYLHHSKPSFELRAECPDITCANALLPLIIGIEHLGHRKNTPVNVPIIYLRNVAVALESITRVRVPAHFHSLGPEPQERSAEKTSIADSGDMRIPLTETWEASQAIQDLFISDTTLPTFKTYNISRTYILHIDLKLECEQKNFGVKMERGLTVLPAFAKATTSPSPGSARIPEYSDEPPPPYEERDRVSSLRLRA